MPLAGLVVFGVCAPVKRSIANHKPYLRPRTAPAELIPASGLVVFGWFALAQRMKVGEIYLPGDSGLVQFKNTFGMAHFVG